MAKTPNYNMDVFSEGDTTTKFLNFRTGIAGTQSTSNFMIIDSQMKANADSIAALKKSGSAYYLSASYYTDFAWAVYPPSSFPKNNTEIPEGTIAVLSLDAVGGSEGFTPKTMELWVNESWYSPVKYLNSRGQLVDLTPDLLEAERPYVMIWNGTMPSGAWVLQLPQSIRTTGRIILPQAPQDLGLRTAITSKEFETGKLQSTYLKPYVSYIYGTDYSNYGNFTYKIGDIIYLYQHDNVSRWADVVLMCTKDGTFVRDNDDQIQYLTLFTNIVGQS